MLCIDHNGSEFSFKTLNWSNFEIFNSAFNYGLKLQFLNLNIISKPGLNSDFFRKKFQIQQNSDFLGYKTLHRSVMVTKSENAEEWLCRIFKIAHCRDAKHYLKIILFCILKTRLKRSDFSQFLVCMNSTNLRQPKKISSQGN